MTLQSAGLKASPGERRRALPDQLSSALSPNSQRKDKQQWSESHGPTFTCTIFTFLRRSQQGKREDSSSQGGRSENRKRQKIVFHRSGVERITSSSVVEVETGASQRKMKSAVSVATERVRNFRIWLLGG